MNATTLHKSLLIFSRCNERCMKLYTSSNNLVPYTHPHFNNTVISKSNGKSDLDSKHDRSRNKSVNITSKVRDSQVYQFISSNKNNPDTFGTLSKDWKMYEQLKTFPDEEDDIIETEFLNNTEGKSRLSINKYASLIKKFLREKKIGHAIEVLETRMLKQDRMKPDNYIYNLLIGGCGEVGYTKKAFKLFKQMRTRGQKVTGHTYTGLFNACANSPFSEDGLARANRLREILLENGFLMNRIIYHAMIKAYGRCGDLDTAFTLVDEMLEKKIFVSDVTFNFLLQACITDKTSGFRHALLVWRKMLEKRVRPGLFSFNLLLRCCRDCGLGDEAAMHQVIKVILQAGQAYQMTMNKPLIEAASNKKGSHEVAVTHSVENVPNLISQQPTLGSVVAVDNITLPEHRLMLMGGSYGILQQMALYKVKPDIKTFTQLLDQIPSNLEAEQALLNEMKKAKVSLDVDFCNMLMRKRCFRVDYENAQAVLKTIQEENLRPDIVTFGVLAMTCNSQSTAKQLLDDIEEFGYRPNLEILGSLLKSACYSRDCDFIIEVMKVYKKEEINPNVKALKCLNNFYHFASSVLNKQAVDDSGVLTMPQFKKYCEYYQDWQKDLKIEDLPHPWTQFEDVHFEPEDVELINFGRVKYSK